MNRRRVLLGIALAGSFLAGCVIGGGAVFYRTMSTHAGVLDFLLLTRSGSDAYVRYRYGSYAIAKAALLEHVEQLTSSSSREGILSEAGAEFDLGLTYGRLAIAAERAGRTAESAEYMQRAVQVFDKRDRPVDENQLRASVLQIDADWDRRLSGAGK